MIKNPWKNQYYNKLSPVEVGQLIVIRGTVPSDSDRFNIDLNSGKFDDIHSNDVQFHLSVRYDVSLILKPLSGNNFNFFSAQSEVW
jgi:hypothetical protein